MSTASYTHLRAHLAAIWEEVEKEPVVIQRSGHQDMASIPAEELSGLLETAHLLRSTKKRGAAARR